MENLGLKLGKKTLSGTLWSYIAFYSGKLMVLLSTIILARLLEKDDFGVAGYALVVIGFLDVFADLGIGQALIYHPKDTLTSSTGFWLGFVVALTLFAGTWVAGPWVGDYFQDSRAVSVTRLLALTFPISAMGNVHSVLMSKELQFRKKFLPEFVRAIGKGVVSIVLAALGFGYWSLIAGQLAGTLSGVIAYWAVYPWRPSFQFSMAKARGMLSYGINIVGVSGLSVLQSSAPSILVGRYVGSVGLGIYQLAFRVPDLLIGQFCSIVSQVIFPVYSSIQEDLAVLRRGFEIATRYLSLITVPMGVGLALIARPFVLVIFSEKWESSIPVVQAIALYSMLLSLSYSAGSVYKATGRPHILSRLSLIEVLYEIPIFIWAALTFKSVYVMAWMLTLLTVTTTTLELSVASWALKLPLLRILRALAPALLASGVMGAAILGSLKLMENLPDIVQLVAGIIVGGGVYLGTLWVFQRQLVIETIQFLKKAIRKEE
ncbi:MAG: lipopolysaccharide biosynthesis protein [Anaerolineaceae bacterium]|nr:lipopolysaccharide biosynthesis protein [Anaerolineaceae bacterium]